MTPEPIDEPDSPAPDPAPTPEEGVVTVEVVVDCQTLEGSVRPVTPQTLAEMAATAERMYYEDWDAAIMEDRRWEAMQVVSARAEEDPAFAALLELLQ